MSEAIITVSQLGKKYRISHQGERQQYTTLRDVIAQKARSFFRSRPILASDLRPRTSGAVASSVLRPPSSGKSSEDFWALKDVSFEVKQGEVVGIIGRNGAGKSTLLKVLSRITEPTEGRVHLRGRVASLLEVGTGFHPELTGRENVYLNGAILGMSRAEIRKKFDEIVAFAEVEKFLDTPVKRYSSGMYVRLAFAVAAHLEPEILIVDEVLAVGDAEFQQKCLGKMESVSRKEGRTVLFVSHNMVAIKSLTTRCVLLNAGDRVFEGTTEKCLELYANITNKHVSDESVIIGSGTHTQILRAKLLNENGVETAHQASLQPMRLEVEFRTDGTGGLSLEAFLRGEDFTRLGMASIYQFHGLALPLIPGRYKCHIQLQPLPLASGNYTFDISTSIINSNWDHYIDRAIRFEVPYSNPGGQTLDFKQSLRYGALALLLDPEVTFQKVS